MILTSVACCKLGKIAGSVTGEAVKTEPFSVTCNLKAAGGAWDFPESSRHLARQFKVSLAAKETPCSCNAFT